MISIVTTTYNKAKYLDLTLAGYQIQTNKDFELIIIDDGGNDNTPQVVDKYKPFINIKYCRHEHQGRAAAKNRGLQLAESDYIILTDDDRIPCPEFVSEHKKILDEKGKVACIGKMGNIISFYNEGLSFSFVDGLKLFNKFPNLTSSADIQLITPHDIITDFSQTIEKYLYSYNSTGNLLEMADKYGDDLNGFHLAWSKAYGGNLSFNRKYCKETVNFDPNYKGYGCEDVDFSYQLYLQGYNFCFSRNAINYHQEHKRGEKELQEVYHNSQYLYNKFPHLELILVKLDIEGVITLEEANSIIELLRIQDKTIIPLINDYFERKKAREST